MVKDVGSFSSGINVLDVLLENSVSEAYLNEGVEILNGTKTPEQAMADIHDVAVEAKKKLGKIVRADGQLAETCSAVRYADICLHGARNPVLLSLFTPLGAGGPAVKKPAGAAMPHRRESK